MNHLLAIPIEIRMAAVFALGICLGSLANLGIYRLAWHRRAISPWSRADAKAPSRRWSDRLPILGWLGLRREASLHGVGFWIRPMLVELLVGVGLAALYWWEVERLGLLPAEIQPVSEAVRLVLHQQFAAHLLLIFCMIVASLIDVDEKTIPDAITVPGTLAGLMLATVWPRSLLPVIVEQGPNCLPCSLLPVIVEQGPGFWPPMPQPMFVEQYLFFLKFNAPGIWRQAFNNSPGPGWMLAVCLACWWAWCVALMPRTWYSRHGFRRACGLSWARVVRERTSYRLTLMGLIGSAVIGVIWFRGGISLVGLLTALMGLAGGGGLVWLVRVIGTAALRREAMGFGDVTLLAMIGAFLGWQTSLVIFFLAPFAALVIGIIQLVVRRDSEIPYGPFLCLATLVVVVRWADVWDRTFRIFDLGWFVPAVVLACMGLMGLMLGGWQWLKCRFQHPSV
ncbi:MAG: A24 family peptidase [Thermoguttaceae bacterium]